MKRYNGQFFNVNLTAEGKKEKWTKKREGGFHRGERQNQKKESSGLFETHKKGARKDGKVPGRKNESLETFPTGRREKPPTPGGGKKTGERGL